MSVKEDQHRQPGSCILFESPDHSTVLVDIPCSIEEAQVLPGHIVKRRIISSDPVETPWKTPEPKKDLGQSTSALSAIAELMTLESVKAALQNVRDNYRGPWCLPRVSRDADSNDDSSSLNDTRKRKQTDPAVETVDAALKPLVPERSHYHLGTIESQRETFLADSPMFDLIVLDPPWPSRSVKRKQNSYMIAYGMREARDLLGQIPVSARLKANGLVAVWVTNKPAAVNLLTSPTGMFSEWGLELVGEWIWLKVTSIGEPVIDIESQWRKPWERLLLGRRRDCAVKAPIPTKVIIGVPDTHSRKPNLRPFFESIMPQNYTGLEVFARNLTAGWWSWGNEVLYFQQEHHWVEITDDK
ncbi:MT-A70-domain-containing protein [Hypoxylon rubiginosum]|uniref:MT-A70-domain-containing protein n=1 Tax=Hypoxylon rubiginosum TaxID=110542 RepID=A0ACC0DFY2_9PEZI|nr:MT-A70-domain-containing protein [Hypoxylon rubiginosum]